MCQAHTTLNPKGLWSAGIKLRKYCIETGNEWDEGVPFVLFALREVRQDSLGFSPSELVFGHNVPILRRKRMSLILCLILVNVYIKRVLWLGKLFLSRRKKIKRCFDQKAVVRNFVPGEKVLVLIPIPGSALTARFSGPYMIKSKVGEMDYIILNGEEKIVFVT